MNPEEEIGKIEVKYEEPLIAGQLVTVVFEYTVGTEGLQENGRLRIGLPNLGWAEPEVPQYYFWSEFAKGKDRRYTDYDRVNTTARFRSDTPAVPLLEAEARFRKPWSYPPTWLRDYDRFWITVTAEDAALRPGDKIIVTYGDPGELPLTAHVQKFPEERICFLAYVDSRNNGEFHEVPGSPWFAKVHSGPPSRMQVILPSIIGTEQKPWIRVAYTDDVQASPSPLPHVGQAELRSEGDNLFPKVVEVNRKLDFLRMEVPELAESEKSDKSIRVTVCDLERDWTARSNPSLKRAGGFLLFWGDLHATAVQIS